MGLAAVAAAALVAAALGGGCGGSRGPEDGSQGSAKEAPLAVRVVEVRRAALTEKVCVTGSLRSPAEVAVRPEVSGRLAEVRVEEGTAVAAGDVLAVVEQDIYLAELHQAEAAVAVAQATLARAQFSLDNLIREKRRIENLFSEGVATEQQRDDILTRHHDALAAKQLAQAQLAQAQAALEVARIRLADTTLRAPLAGVIAEKRVEPGDMVSPQVSMFRLVRTDSLEVHFTVSEQYLRFLREGGTRVEIEVDALPGERFSTVVSQVYPTVDPEARTVAVEAVLQNREGRLRPGLSARACVVLREVPRALVVPAEAVQAATTEPFVYRVGQGVAQKVSVEVGLREGPLVEVRSGLEEGDLVVVGGQQRLRSGSPVRVVREDEEP